MFSKLNAIVYIFITNNNIDRFIKFLFLKIIFDVVCTTNTHPHFFYFQNEITIVLMFVTQVYVKK